MSKALRVGPLMLTAIAFGATLGALPALAGSEATPSVAAVNAGLYSHYWSPERSAVAVGGQITVSNPSSVRHGVQWVGGPVVPSCAAGVPVGSSEAAAGTEWSGACSFPVAGVYTFYCTVHGAAMAATVTVGATSTTTGSTSTPSTTTSGETTSSGSAAPPPATGAPGAGGAPALAPGSPLLGAAAHAVALATAAHGRSVKGTVAVSAAGAGGRLEVDVYLARVSGAGHGLRVGRAVRAPLRAGRVAFAVSLDARGLRALRRSRHLAVSVVVALRPLRGPVVSLTRRISLHG